MNNFRDNMWFFLTKWGDRLEGFRIRPFYYIGSFLWWIAERIDPDSPIGLKISKANSADLAGLPCKDPQYDIGHCIICKSEVMKDFGSPDCVCHNCKVILAGWTVVTAKHNIPAGPLSDCRFCGAEFIKESDWVADVCDDCRASGVFHL